MAFHDLEIKIHQMVDELQGMCSELGLSNSPNEEVIVTSVFLYKFLNDKFMYNLDKFASDIHMTTEDVLKNEKILALFYKKNAKEVAFGYEDTIQYLVNNIEQDNFSEQFDAALVRIAKHPNNETFAVENASGEKAPLFKPLTELVESSARRNLAKRIFGIITQEKFDFAEAFNGGFDFYSAIFEYLIKNYNVGSGDYAEYFTPQAVSSIIAKILVGMSNKIDAAEIYDPSAGSGSLILHLAHELGQEAGMNRAIVYTQDISEKSTRFLRLNMMLNGKNESLGNIVRGDTMLSPAHFMIEGEHSSGLKKFDYITSNPPFGIPKFSTDLRNAIETKWEDTDRFFAGVPNNPPKKKFQIYLTFIQHILYSLKDNGKAAIVVPTGFITAQSGIAKKIREEMVAKKMLKGVISMPSNIFANTGTNVSVIFLDKANTSNEVLFVDASQLGTSIKDGNNERTVLNEEEIDKIINTFINRDVIEDFSVKVTYEQITEKNYSFSAGQYFDVKIEYVEITQEEYDKMIEDFNVDFAKYVEETKKFQENIKKQLGGLKLNEKTN